LKRTDTLVQKRGDSDGYRWIAQSVRRHAMNLREVEEEEVITQATGDSFGGDLASPRSAFRAPVFHGMMQLMAMGSGARPGAPQADFFGTNFAVSGTVGSDFEMASIGQRGAGKLAPQRLAAIATMRPGAKHQVTATIGYGQVALARKLFRETDAIGDLANEPGARIPVHHT